MSTSRQWLALLVSAVVIGEALLPAQRRNIGFVVAVDGPWLANGQLVKRGQSLQSGARISAPSANVTLPTAYSISVRLLDDRPWSRVCNSLSTCSAIVTLPDALGEPAPFFSRLADAFNRLVGDDEERYAVAKSRSAQTAMGLPDGVVRLEGRQVSVGLLFNNLPAGRYLLEFWRAEPASVPLPTVTFDWDLKQQSAAWPDNAPAGVYEVSVYRNRTNEGAIGKPAWWLVEPAARYARSKAAFDEAVTATQSWRRDLDDASLADLLHAHLDSLAAH